MKVIQGSACLPDVTSTVVGLGFFDGFHKGHILILDKAVDEARSRGAASVLYTYSERPEKVIRGTDTPLLMSLEAKIRYLSARGLDILCLENFDRDYAQMSPEAFVRDLLVSKLKACAVVAGFNYTFGDRGSGNAEMLTRLGKDAGIETFVVPPVTVDGEVVSSTLIRKYISEGDMERAARMLGRPYTLEGEVRPGRRIGHRIGFPTANITVDLCQSIPANGVYLTLTSIDGVLHPSVTNVGINPTVAESLTNVPEHPLRLETHILDFNKEIYKKSIEVSFIRKIRNEIRFSSEQQLAEQIAADVRQARRAFKKVGEGIR